MSGRTYIEVYDPPVPACPDCAGSGSEWRRTKTGEYDLRYRNPIGSCPACAGTGRSIDPETHERECGGGRL